MATARRWLPARVVSALRSACGLPDGGEIGRDGRITRLEYRDNGLARRLEVYPEAFGSGLVHWQVSVGDTSTELSVVDETADDVMTLAEKAVTTDASVPL